MRELALRLSLFGRALAVTVAVGRLPVRLASADALVRVAAAQTPEIRENLDAALDCLADFADRAQAAGAYLLCFPEGFLQGYLLHEETARRHALDLASPAFAAVLDRFPKTGPTLVVGLIEVERGCLYNTAVVVERSVLIGRYRKTHLLRGEAIFTPGAESPGL